jgi:uncharacterized caspase-like protein
VRRQHVAEDFLWPDTSPAPIPDSINFLAIVTDGVAAAAGPSRTLPADEGGTLDGIRRAFDWLDEHEDISTTVLLAYSGHGAQVPDDDGDEADGLEEAITTVDTEVTTTTITGLIRDDELGTELSKLESQRVVLIMDSCFAGGLDGSAIAGSLPAGARPRLPIRAPHLQHGSQIDGLAADAAAPGRIILSASRADQVSWEFGELDHGVFSYFLLQGMMDPAADTDHDGWIAAEEAFAYAAPRVDAYVFARTGEHQNPQIYDGVPGQLNLVPLS